MLYYRVIPQKEENIEYEVLMILSPPDEVVFAKRFKSGTVVKDKTIKLPAGKYKTVYDILNSSVGFKRYGAKIDMIQMTRPYTRFVGDYVETAYNELSEQGYLNISLLPVIDHKLLARFRLGKVSKISVGRKTKFAKGELFPADVHIIISYYATKLQQVALKKGYVLTISFPYSNKGFTQAFSSKNQECLLENGFVVVDTNKYGLSPNLIGETVQAKIYYDQIEFFHDHQLVGQFTRSYAR